MKKILFLLALVGMFFTACESDNNGDDTDMNDTSTVMENEDQNNTASTSDIRNPNSMNEDHADASGEYPVMTFEKTTHDFGDVQQGEKVEYVFEFTNTGESDLIIQDARASCGCTVPSYPKEPIAPGETGEIPVIYDSAGKKGVQNKQVTITANTSPNNTTLKIRANVVEI